MLRLSPWPSEAPDRTSPSCSGGSCAPSARSTSPLLPDDYLELINPLWSTRELRGRIERIDARDGRRRDRADQARLPLDGPRARAVPAHRARHQGPPPLARVLADLRPRAARRLHLDHGQERRRGQSSPLPRAPRRGRARSSRSAASRASSCCPTTLPEKLLFISAGSGITPIMSMLRSLAHRDAMDDVVLMHSARTERGRDLRRRAARARGRARGLPAARAAHRARRPDRPRAASTSCAPTGASARRSPPAPARCSTR